MRLRHVSKSPDYLPCRDQPDCAMRGEGEPCLEDERYNAGPVEQGTHHRDFHDHIMEADVVYNEREGMHQSKKEKRIRRPSVKDLNSLVRDPGRKSDPIRLTRCCTESSQFNDSQRPSGCHTKQMACMPMPSSLI